MKLSIYRNNLKRGIDIASKIIQRSITLPILNNILLKTDKSFLNISSTDLELGIKYWALAKIEKEGSIVVPGKLLSALINSVTGEKIDIEVKNTILQIKGEYFKSKILGQSVDDYPIIPYAKDFFAEIEIQPFLKAVSRVIDFTSLTKIRPELSGVYLSFKENKIVAASSDSYRLAEETIDFDNKNNACLILPGRAAREIVNIFGGIEGSFKVYISKTQITFELAREELSFPQIQVTSQLIEGEYPDYKKIIPQEFKNKFTITKEDFVNGLKVAGLFVGGTNEVRVTIDPSKNKMEIFSQNSGIGENKVILNGKAEGDKIDISFNGRFLLEGVLKIETPQIIFQTNNPQSPILIKSSQDDGYLYVLMPIKSE